MKVIGRTVDRYGSVRGAVIEVTESELARMVTGHCSGSVSGVQTGCELKLNERFDHSQDVIRRVNEATRLPGVLRALADTLELAVPQISELTEPTDMPANA